jgi:translocation and assembly module TamB
MTAIEHTPPPSERPARRLRRRILRYGGGAAILLIGALIGGFFWASSAGFENLVRERLVARLETATGGRVEIASFRWHLLDLDAEVAGLVIHGREAAAEGPYAQVDHLHVRISVLGFFSPRILLRDLEIIRPAFHLIVYEDGTTNQPHPRTAPNPGKRVLDTFFDLKADHVSVEQGTLHYENRAADFDFQNRLARLDFAASDVSLVLSYAAASGTMPESYRIEAGARGLHVTRGTQEHPLAPPADGYMQSTIDLTRNAAYLRSLRVTSSDKQTGEHSLLIAGSLIDFARPRWQATGQGDLDMRLLDATTGYPNSPTGIAHVVLTASGHDGQFRVDGPVHIDNGSYIAPGVDARNLNVDAHVHADPEQLLITSVIARLRSGGQFEGTVALDHWLPPVPGEPLLQAATATPAKKQWAFLHKQPPPAPPPPNPVHPGPIPLLVNGKVTAQLRGVTLDAVLDIVGQGPFQRLGMNTLLYGPATATWIHGDVNTLAVSVKLALNSPARSVPGESPTTGALDATYTQRDGAVDLRTLDVSMPASHIQAQGRVGAYPIGSPTAISVDLHTQNLGEFDTLIRDLGLRREGKTGAAALPASLAGTADFRGKWSGSVIDPHLAGNLSASNLSIEMPGASDTSGNLRPVHWDSLEATGSYSAARISIDHGLLSHGKATIAIDGSLTASELPGRRTPTLTFDENSLLRIHVNGSHVDVDELLPLIGQSLPVTGELNTQFDADGPMHSLNGSGWVELDHGIVYGEPLSRVRAQGKIADRVLQLTSVVINDQAGKVSASGSYNLDSREFSISAEGAAIDVSNIHRLQTAAMPLTGQLGFSVHGSGTFNDPHLQAQSTLTGLTLGGQTIGSVQISAHTQNRTVIYDLATHFESASLTAHGETALAAGYSTQAKLDFSQFNIAGPLKLLQIPALTGESDLAGTITLAGPLAHLDQMRGDARLQDLAVTLAGVHLHSDGPVHAALANSRIALDPLHVVGEETDMHAQGTIDFKTARRLDVAANGSINLKLAETLDPDLTASGTTTFQVEAHGPLENPDLRGRIDFDNATLALEDLPNSLSQLHGTLEFSQNRLEVRSLTAMTGGGQLSVAGYLAYQHGIYANLSVIGKNVRIRYPEGVSSLADANLQLLGSQNNLLLSGGIMITRFTMSPDLDIAALATQAGKAQPVALPDAPSNHIRLDVRIQSSPQLNFQNAYAKLAGDVDLRLRGTVATPSLLGRISVTEGSATIAGTRYELQRGDITFSNPVRIEPSIDLNATARVEDYDISLGLHGSPDKMSVSYRSDPPLPEADVVALLALGRTQNEQQIYGQQQEQVAANPTTDILLGGALNATVSSRVQKLFGAGSVKVDPTYLGALGNSTTRITVEEQLGKNLTLTYATDVNTTAQQLLQAEIAINRHVSLLVVRDESGVFSMVIKATRRYR